MPPAFVIKLCVKDLCMVDSAGFISRPEAIAVRGDSAFPAQCVEARIYGSVEEADAVWRGLQQDAACGPAQSFAWTKCWQANVNPDCLAAVLEMNGVPALLLPLEVVAKGFGKMARLPGGSHANCNFPPVARIANVDADAARLLIDALHRERPDIDLVSLDRQLANLDGVANPFLAIDRREHADIALTAPLDGGFEAVLARHNAKRRKKKHRQHAKRYDEAGGWRIVTAEDRPAAIAFLDRFFEVKAERFADAGIHDVFADDKVRSFFRALYGDAVETGRGDFIVQGLEVDGKTIAVMASSSWHRTLSIDFMGFAEGDALSTSPGEFMIYEVMEAACEGPTHTFNLGVGDETYKREWCDTEVTLYDSAIPLTTKGHILAAASATSGAAKRFVKQNRLVWSAVKALRARLR